MQHECLNTHHDFGVFDVVDHYRVIRLLQQRPDHLPLLFISELVPKDNQTDPCMAFCVCPAFKHVSSAHKVFPSHLYLLSDICQGN